ncbi:MAG: hypothetical protein AAB213_00345 [Candidatus Omnitrophota bacterium]
MDQALYKQVKIVGFLSFIPIVLFTGPFMGYIAADYLMKRFNWVSWLPIIGAALGFAASVDESIRIIRIVLKIDKAS